MGTQRTRPRRGLVAGALAGAALFVASGASGQWTRGIYLSMDVGLSRGAATETTLSGPNSPTRCDRLLYPNLSDAPRGAECLAASELGGLYSYDPETGLAGAVAVGYGFGDVSVEVELFQRHQIIHNTLLTLGDAAGAAITGKDTEWSPDRPPWGDISEFRGRQLFANVYYHLRNRSRFTPYVGAGAGVARTDFRYYLGFARKSIAEGYLEAFGGDRTDPSASPDWQRAAAGTTSELATDVSARDPGFQLLGGVDFAFSPRASLGVKGRWVRVPDASRTARWTTIRSHAPVHADGVTPFISTLDFSRLGHWTLSATLKYVL